MSGNKGPVPKWSTVRPFIIPFGKYLGDRRRDPDGDGALIGRETQRGELLGALLDDTHRGAILITGNRGSGKTSLVRHCLKEYQESLFERYRNRAVGKVPSWDLLLSFLLVSGCAAGWQMLASFFLQLRKDPGFWLVSTAASILLALPLILQALNALASFQTRIELHRQRPTSLRSRTLFLSLAAATSIVAVPFPQSIDFPPGFYLGGASSGLSRELLLCGAIALAAVFACAAFLPHKQLAATVDAVLGAKALFFGFLAKAVIFGSSLDLAEWIWPLVIGVCFVAIGAAEVRLLAENPELRADLSRRPLGNNSKEIVERLAATRRAFGQSLFVLLFRHWIPVLVVHINLGLDRLDHRRVIEAMLMQLREEYQKTFAVLPGSPWVA